MVWQFFKIKLDVCHLYIAVPSQITIMLPHKISSIAYAFALTIKYLVHQYIYLGPTSTSSVLLLQSTVHMMYVCAHNCILCNNYDYVGDSQLQRVY